VPASAPASLLLPLVQLPAALHVKPVGQPALEVHFAVHCFVASLQMLFGTAMPHSASVAQVQKVAVELPIFAQVFSLAGQSLPDVQVETQVLSTG
jgi:hypothetical protein